MRNLNTYLVVVISVILCLFSCVAILVNHIWYHYPGNNYYPPEGFVLIFIVVLAYLGCYLQWDNNHLLTKFIIEINFFLLVMSIIAFATNAVQFTPFNPIDKNLLKFESYFHIDLNAIMAWTTQRPYFKRILIFAYETLPYQMCYIPIIFIFAKKWTQVREYYFLLLGVSLLGFICYYFLPTEAPSSVIDSSYFLPPQRDTPLKFFQIHHYIAPTTMDGGMISLPSFHVMWAYCCLHLLRTFPWAFFLALPINILLVLSCVLLGWHYVIDLVVAGFIFQLVRAIYQWLSHEAIPKFLGWYKMELGMPENF